MIVDTVFWMCRWYGGRLISAVLVSPLAVFISPFSLFLLPSFAASGTLFKFNFYFTL